MDKLTNVIHVRLSDTELDELRRAAGDVPIGRYVRRRLFDTLPAAKRENHKPLAQKLQSGEAKEVVKELRKNGKSCAHGTAKGYHCWQCGGVASCDA